MKHIQTDYLYLADNFSNYLKANIYLDYSKNDLNFRESDIAFIRLVHYRPLSDIHYDVEINNKKEMIGEESFFGISDSVINIIEKVMGYQQFYSMDIMPVLRFKHIKLMKEFTEKNKPMDLSYEKGLSDLLMESKTEFVGLFFNEEEKKLAVGYVLIDDENPNDNFWAEYAENGYFPVFFDKKSYVLDLFNEFNNVLNKKTKVLKENIYLHTYNRMGNTPFSPIEKEATQSRFLHFKSLVVDDYEEFQEKVLKKELSVIEALDFFDINKENYAESIDEYNEFREKYCIEENIYATINLISLGEYSDDELKDIEKIYMNTIKEYESLSSKQAEFNLFVDEVKKQFEERSKNDFKD